MMNDEWNKSSYSNAGSECVECCASPGGVGVRDTQHRHLTTLPFPADAWNDFIAGLKRDDMR